MDLSPTAARHSIVTTSSFYRQDKLRQTTAYTTGKSSRPVGPVEPIRVHALTRRTQGLFPCALYLWMPIGLTYTG